MCTNICLRALHFHCMNVWRFIFRFFFFENNLLRIAVMWFGRRVLRARHKSYEGYTFAVLVTHRSIAMRQTGHLHLLQFVQFSYAERSILTSEHGSRKYKRLPTSKTNVRSTSSNIAFSRRFDHRIEMSF